MATLPAHPRSTIGIRVIAAFMSTLALLGVLYAGSCSRDGGGGNGDWHSDRGYD
jgi:hypothetical protein